MPIHNGEASHTRDPAVFMAIASAAYKADLTEIKATANCCQSMTPCLNTARLDTLT